MRGPSLVRTICFVVAALLSTATLSRVAQGQEKQGKALPATSAALTDSEMRAKDSQPVEGHPRLRWKYAEVEVEWGFQPGSETRAFDGTIESTHLLGSAGTAQPLPEDKVTVMAGQRTWKSPAAGGARRGIVVPHLPE